MAVPAGASAHSRGEEDAESTDLHVADDIEPLSRAASEYADRFGVSPDEALAILNERQQIQPVIDLLADEHPGKFAGFIVHNGHDFGVEILVKGRLNGQMRAIAAGAQGRGLRVSLVDGMPKSIGELQRQQQQLHDVLTRRGHAAASAINVVEGTIEVSVGRGSNRVRPELPELPPQANASNVRVRISDEEIGSDAQHMYGGGVLGTGNGSAACGAGFAVRMNTGHDAYLTAAHCVDDHNLSTYIDPYVVEDATVIETGHRYYGDLGDIALVRSVGHVERPWIFHFDSTMIRPIRSVRNIYGYGVGDWACMYTLRGEVEGARGGDGYGCSTIEQPYFSQTTEHNVHVNWFVLLTDNMTVGGESGGPWRIGNEALGVHHGVCTSGWWNSGSCFTRAGFSGVVAGSTINFG